MTIAEAIRKTRKKIVENLNESGLPLDVMDLLLLSINTSVHQQAEDEYRKEREDSERKEE